MPELYRNQERGERRKLSALALAACAAGLMALGACAPADRPSSSPVPALAAASAPAASAAPGTTELKQPQGTAQGEMEPIMTNVQTQAQDLLKKIDRSQLKLAPTIEGDTWINSPRLNWQELRGKVVVVDFWTFACYNCKNTLPYLKSWDDKYRARGLVVLGVHSPELSFEKDVENVRNAVKDYQIKYPVVIDGDFANWDRYRVGAWPTWFIVDKAGYIRYSHIGEGDYNRSEQVIQQLLAEQN